MAEPLTIGTITAALAGLIGYGELKQRVKTNTKTIDKLATDEKLDLVHSSLEGRLVRIENKLDKANGNG
jgi:hypothetical protein